MFRVILHRNAKKFLDKLDKNLKGNITSKLRELENFPDSLKILDIKKVKGYENTFRLRIGKYRALFRVYQEDQLIVVAKIDVRGKIYKGGMQ